MQTKASLDYLKKIYANMGDKEIDRRLEETLVRLSQTDWGVREYLDIFVEELKAQGLSKSEILSNIGMLDIIDRT